jgi:glycosyltransferase involved in cell wall biosynthesis
MRFWLINAGEPTPLDSSQQRLRRVGILSKMLIERGHEVLWWSSTFFHMGKRQRFAEDTTLNFNEGYRIRFLHGPAYRKNVSLKRLHNHAVLGRKFRHFVRKEPRPDLVLAALPTIELSYEAARFGRRQGVPTVIDIRDLWPDSFLQLMPRWFRRPGRLALSPYFHMAKRACAEATAICGNTREFVEWGLACGRRRATDRDREFPFGYAPPELSHAEQSAARDYWRALGIGANPQTPIACFFGGVNHHFDFEMVIAAARELNSRRRVQFVFCGDGELRAQYAQRTAADRDIFFTGQLDSAKIWTLMEMSSFGLAPYVPSPNFINNIPNKPIEYLAGGLPILNSLARGPLANLIAQHGCGACYDGSVNKLVHIIDELCDRPAQLAAAKQSAKEAFQGRFDAATVYGRMITHLEAIAVDYRDTRNQ